MVVIDQHLPDGQGGALLPTIGSFDVPTPVVCFTADGRPETRRALLDAGAWDVVTKPFDVVEARAKLAAMIDAASRVWQAEERAHRFAVDAYRVLVRIAERFGAEPAGHAERVGWIAGLIARELGWSWDDVATLRAAAALHDLGKLAVPLDLLGKPGRLTSEERNVIERHAVAGAELFEGTTDATFALAREIAATHHERWDGRGYPHALRGKQIPISGRIVAVADVFDALVSKRVYKEAVTALEALEVIQEGRGQAFDPAVVDAFELVFMAATARDLGVSAAVSEPLST